MTWLVLAYCFMTAGCVLAGIVRPLVVRKVPIQHHHHHQKGHHE